MKYTYTLFAFLISSIAFTQNDKSPDILKNKHIDYHSHFGLATGPVYILNENAFALGLHLHYMRLINVGNTHFGIGLGLEAIYDEHRHYATSLNLSYLPIHELTITVAPGIQFAPESEDFTTHFEAVYEFEIGKMHIGPVAEYAWAPNDAHVMFGLHLGFSFGSIAKKVIDE